MTAEQIYDTIYQHLITKSFGQEVYADKALCDKLRRSLPMMMNSMLIRQQTDLKIDIAYDAASRLDEAIAKLKPDVERRLCFEAGLVLLAYNQISNTGTGLFQTVDQLLERYPELNVDPPLEAKELDALLLFRNVMVVALRLISASGSKNHLLDLVTRIAEGRSVKYITGSGERIATSCRVLIYRREGNVNATPKRPKQTSAVASANGPRDGSVDDESVAGSDAPTSTAGGTSSSAKAPRTAKKRSNHKVTDFASRIGKRSKSQQAPVDTLAAPYLHDDMEAISLPRVAEPHVAAMLPVDESSLRDQLSCSPSGAIVGSTRNMSSSMPVMRGLSSLYSDASMGYFGQVVGSSGEGVSMGDRFVVGNSITTDDDQSAYSTLDHFVGKPFPAAVALTAAVKHPSNLGGESGKPLAWYPAPTSSGTRSHSLDIVGGPALMKCDHSLDIHFGIRHHNNSVDRQISLETVDTPENDFFGRQFLSYPELFNGNGITTDKTHHIASLSTSHPAGYVFPSVVATTAAATVDMFAANVNTDAAASLVLLRSSSAT